MKNKKRKASAILSADIHIRPDTPICRTDNFFVTMEKKIDFIISLAKENDCPILSSGDLGHKPQWKNWLLEWTINRFKDIDVIICAGQHDLPGHRLTDWDKSGIGVLHAAGAINFIQEPTWYDDFLIHPFSYGQEIIPPEKNKNITITEEFINIAMTHQIIIEKGDLYPGQDGYKGNKVLADNPGYSLILSGDNHSPFTAKHKNQLLVNPGSMMRTTAIQADHKPRVYLWYADDNSIEPVYLPIEEGVVSRDHVKAKDDRTDRYDAFVQKLREDIELELSFPDNMEKYLKRFRTEIKVKSKIMTAMGEK